MYRRLLAAILLAVFGASCGQTEGDSEEAVLRASIPHRVDARGRVLLSADEREVLGLVAQPARREILRTTDVRYATVLAKPEDEILVVAPVTGLLPEPPWVTQGTEVGPGQVLLQIDPLLAAASRASLVAQGRQFESGITAARARIRALEAELRRVETLASSQLATSAEVARAGAELEAERASLEGLRGATGALDGATGGRLDVRAPIAGSVEILSPAVGALALQGTPLARIVRSGPRWLDVAVPPFDDVGSSYRVRAHTGFVAANLLARGRAVEDDGMRHDRLGVSISSRDGLLPGQTVVVEIVHEIEGIVLPHSAVVPRGASWFVFVEEEPGRYLARNVRIGVRDETRVAIISGIRVAERVVTRGAVELGYELENASEETDPGNMQ